MNRHFFVILKMVVRWWWCAPKPRLLSWSMPSGNEGLMGLGWIGIKKYHRPGTGWIFVRSFLQQLRTLTGSTKGWRCFEPAVMADRIGRQMQQVQRWLSLSKLNFAQVAWQTVGLCSGRRTTIYCASLDGRIWLLDPWQGSTWWQLVESLRVAIPHPQRHPFVNSINFELLPWSMFEWSVPIHLCNPLQLYC